MVILYNNRDGDARIVMGATDFVPVPAVFIGQLAGEALRDWIATNSSARAQLRATSAVYTFTVPDTLLCEHVALRVDSTHSSRGDLRIVLTSPAGTRSVLQRINNDQTRGPADWTYRSTQHFYESSAGAWTVAITDEDLRGSGAVTSISLMITGTEIQDTDRDGLDDRWENTRLGSLAGRPQMDPDRDGYNNAREQIMGTDPLRADQPFQLEISVWNENLARLSWPGSTNLVYDIERGSSAAAPLNLGARVPGRFPVTEWFAPYTNAFSQFFRVKAALPNQ
jgi:subtilisin-like proprotein convertase family protein